MTPGSDKKFLEKDANNMVDSDSENEVEGDDTGSATGTGNNQSQDDAGSEDEEDDGRRVEKTKKNPPKADPFKVMKPAKSFMDITDLARLTAGAFYPVVVAMVMSHNNKGGAMDAYTSRLEEAIHVLLKKLLNDLKPAADVTFQDNLRNATMKAAHIYAKQKSPALLARCLGKELKRHKLESVTVRKGPEADFTINKHLVATCCQGDMNKEKDAQVKDMDAAKEKEGKENKRPKKHRPRPNL
jgi:hypothetical protein